MLGHFSCQILKTSKGWRLCNPSGQPVPLPHCHGEKVFPHTQYEHLISTCAIFPCPPRPVVETLAPCPQWSPVVMGVRRREHTAKGLQSCLVSRTNKPQLSSLTAWVVQPWPFQFVSICNSLESPLHCLLQVIYWNVKRASSRDRLCSASLVRPPGINQHPLRQTIPTGILPSGCSASRLNTLDTRIWCKTVSKALVTFTTTSLPKCLPKDTLLSWWLPLLLHACVDATKALASKCNFKQGHFVYHAENAFLWNNAWYYLWMLSSRSVLL